MRVAAVCVALAACASTASAAIGPSFDRDKAEPGETVTLTLEGRSIFRAPFRFALVRRDLEMSLTGPSDPRLVHIADLGTPGEFDIPRTFEFTVPEIPAATYVAVLWYQSHDSRPWQNVAVGLRVELTVVEPDGGFLRTALAVTAGGALLGMSAFVARRRFRRPRDL